MSLPVISEERLHELEKTYGSTYFNSENDVHPPVPSYIFLNLDSAVLTTNKGVVLGIADEEIVTFAKRVIKDFEKLSPRLNLKQPVNK